MIKDCLFTEKITNRISANEDEIKILQHPIQMRKATAALQTLIMEQQPSLPHVGEQIVSAWVIQNDIESSSTFSGRSAQQRHGDYR